MSSARRQPGNVLREGTDVGQARFVFNMAAALPWVVLDATVPVPVDLGELPSPAICWRLLSANNRQLGRSADVFDDLAACVRAVELLLVGLDDAEPLVTRHRAPVRWTWRVLEGNRVVAMSGRSFEAERQAIRTLDNFLGSAGRASVVPEIMGLPTTRSEPFPEPLPLIERRQIQ
jgi:hypothetical protein